MLEQIRIAIDGPGGAGKSTIAKKIAEKLAIEYIDTGAMYRAIGYKLLNLGISPEDEEAIRPVLDDTSIDFKDGHIYLDGHDISGEIRTPEVSMAASDCSQFSIVRKKLVAIQQEIAAGKSVVMDGRDIGTVVLKDAELKVFLTADPMIRAKRRYDEMIAKGQEADLEQIYKEMLERDYQDTHREVDPLKQAEDAVLLDSSYMSIEEVVDKMIDLVESRGYPV